MTINIFWFRRDLRLQDNAGLYHALKSSQPVLPIFIFDIKILDQLEDEYDARVTFLYDTLVELKSELEVLGSTLLVFYGTPINIWQQITAAIEVSKVFINHDYERYALQRDKDIKEFLNAQNIEFQTFKDHVIFEYDEVTKDDGKPYTVFTPYSRKWLAKLQSRLSAVEGEKISFYLKSYPTEKYFSNLYQDISQLSKSIFSENIEAIPTLESMHFKRSDIPIPPKSVARSIILNYHKTRNFPALEHSTSRLGIHFRFGTISIRAKALAAMQLNDVFLKELIWRDFYSQILQHFPHIDTGKAFRPAYERIEWRDDEEGFQKWCAGKTGYPIVDAGMRQMNAIGYMHNRVRMITSSFLTKHLLIDWRLGEAYFAQKLLDYEFASNNGGWQWSSGSGTDAAPYFRIFNPMEQQKKFDPDFKYIKQWVPEYGTPQYPTPMVDHREARARCLSVYAKALKNED